MTRADRDADAGKKNRRDPRKPNLCKRRGKKTSAELHDRRGNGYRDCDLDITLCPWALSMFHARTIMPIGREPSYLYNQSVVCRPTHSGRSLTNPIMPDHPVCGSGLAMALCRHGVCVCVCVPSHPIPSAHSQSIEGDPTRPCPNHCVFSLRLAISDAKVIWAGDAVSLPTCVVGSFVRQSVPTTDFWAMHGHSFRQIGCPISILAAVTHTHTHTQPSWAG